MKRTETWTQQEQLWLGSPCVLLCFYQLEMEEGDLPWGCPTCIRRPFGAAPTHDTCVHGGTSPARSVRATNPSRSIGNRKSTQGDASSQQQLQRKPCSSPKLCKNQGGKASFPSSPCASTPLAGQELLGAQENLFNC